MLFPSIPFLYYFFPLTLLLYIAVPRKYKNALLLCASMVFYAWGEQTLVLVFALSIFLGWLFGILIDKHRGTRGAKLLLVAAVCFNLSLLGYFKYTDFFISSLNTVLGISIPLLRIALPIGISFYTFQILSYTVDVYRGSVAVQKNIVDFGTYISFFPQLIAGPIVRYSDIAPQLCERTMSVDDAAAGLRRFILGLGKKVLLANALGEIVTQFQHSSELSVLWYWLYAVAFMLQIYFDFSAYSDMAIGLARIFGFRLIENFNYPYMSVTITEFWRRWHISLGSWFRDYVYIPLGGNRRGMARQLFNILVVWSLTGFWHGAAWNFILWGMFYAVLLIFEKLFLKKQLERLPVLGHVYVLLTVMLGFVIFNAADIYAAVRDIAGMFAFNRLPLVSAEALYYLRSYAVILAFSIVGATPLVSTLVKKLCCTKLRPALNALEPLLLLALFAVVTAYLVDGSFNPFLYFRF